MKFSEALTEWIELREAGPDESDGYTDKAHYRRLAELEAIMDGERAAAGGATRQDRAAEICGVLTEHFRGQASACAQAAIAVDRVLQLRWAAGLDRDEEG